ncbi:IS200/IS605 family transposase [Thermococcus sibiricus]|uniref:IS200-like transposase n=1 Tax=Thermococcus sibiricus TaxID=172049 RepID=A0A101EN26_9EURY|nr:IS200/IS605 family transposase [Thermococcus sibiricus]KUK18197.1 MAG: IS200-like transposase [Thermococcus sibiricus]MBC7334281.1 IS200/IS605 family transposase [Actinomycetota bacterium]
MKYKLDRGAHSVYALYYHLILVIKYRRKVFTDDRIIDFLKQKIHEISETHEVEILAIETDQDHVHILFKAKPTLNIPKYINALKTITSREIRRNFPEVKERLWRNAFWSPSYFLATSGQVTLDVLKAYVESQGEKE